MYYLCSENKGADQLRGYREADLRLCFRICKMLVFSLHGSNDIDANVNLSCLTSSFCIIALELGLVVPSTVRLTILIRGQVVK